MNKFISAELPDKDSDPVAYNAVVKHVMHGPCGNANVRCPWIVAMCQHLKQVGGCLNFQYSIESLTHKEACKTLGLLEGDSEWHETLKEAAQWASARALRELFVTLLLFCEVSDLWKFRPILVEGGVYFIQKFKVLNSNAGYRPVSHVYAIHFTFHTSMQLKDGPCHKSS